MPTNSTYAAIPIPTGTETSWGPTPFAALVAAIDTAVVLKATSQSDRDTRFAGVDSGTIVSCAALQTIWQKVSGGWVTLANIGPIVTSGIISNATNWTIAFQVGQKVNGRTSARIGATWGGGAALTAGADGNITDNLMGTIVPTWLPNAAWWTGSQDLYFYGNSGSDMRLGADGSLYLASLHPNASVAIGSQVRFNLEYPGV